MSKLIGGGMMAFGALGFVTGDIEGGGALFIFGAMTFAFWAD